MSNAILCDRCGNRMNRLLGIRLESKWPMFGTKYDLCPKCAEDFEEFMRNDDEQKKPEKIDVWYSNVGREVTHRMPDIGLPEEETDHVMDQR